MRIDHELRAARLLRARLREESGWSPPVKVQPPTPPRATKPLPDLWPIAQAIMNAVSQCVPDGDPIDLLGPKLRHMGIDAGDVTKWLDRACRKHLGTRTYSRYLINAWDGWNEVCEPDQRMDNPWRP